MIESFNSNFFFELFILIRDCEPFKSKLISQIFRRKTDYNNYYEELISKIELNAFYLNLFLDL